MRILLTHIAYEYGLNPDQMFAFAKTYGGYALRGNSVDDATVPTIMKSAIAYDFKMANKKGDWRENIVSESLDEFLKSKRL